MRFVIDLVLVGAAILAIFYEFIRSEQRLPHHSDGLGASVSDAAVRGHVNES
jgi:hypothetical protein